MEHVTAPRPDPKRKDFFDYRKIRELRDAYFEQRGHGAAPEKFLVRSDHFLRLFNEDFKLKGDKVLSRRTLQFYSSPQLRLFPLPTYLNRHTAHYLFPDHYELLGAIWTMRSKLFMPIDMIRAVLKAAGPQLYPLIMDWDESPEGLIDAVMLEKRQELEPEEFHLYRASKDLLEDAHSRAENRSQTEAEAKRAMLKELEKQYEATKKWIETGRAGRFLSALTEGRREFADLREKLEDLAAEQGEDAG